MPPESPVYQTTTKVGIKVNSVRNNSVSFGPEESLSSLSLTFSIQSSSSSVSLMRSSVQLSEKCVSFCSFYSLTKLKGETMS